MKKKLFFLLSVSTLLISFCVPPAPNQGATATAALPTPINIDTATPPVEIPTVTFTPTAAPNPEPSQTPTAPSISDLQFLAYMREGQLLVTDVTNGVQGGTTQYTMAGVGDQVSDIVWSPSGEFVAFVSNTNPIEPHIFYIYALGASSPTDLGPGTLPAWSPDSQSVAYVSGSYPDDNIWVTTIENPAPRQLTFEKNYTWGRPAFKPDGQSLVGAGTDRMNLGASGNTNFTLETLALDGSGTRAPLPGATLMQAVRLPYDLRFSPNGNALSFSTSYHLSACAAPGAYYVSNENGSNQQEMVSPSLKPAIDPNKQTYHVGLSYGWSPNSDAIVIFGNVVDCDPNSANMGKSIAGPQMSILGMDGHERLVIPGFFMSLSMDRTGTMIGAAHYKDYQDTQPVVEIHSAQTGQLILSLGTGNYPAFQP
jgi:hypothetical protein